MTYHNGNQFMVVTRESDEAVAFGPFTIDKAHEFIGAMRQAKLATATTFGVMRAAMVDSRIAVAGA